MKQFKESNRYAKALIRNVGDDKVPQTLAEIGLLNELMAKSKEFKSLLVNPQFTADERAKVFRAIAEKLKISEATVKYVLHLSDLGIVIYLAQILRVAINLYLEKQRRAKAVVMTPIEIGKGQEEKLKSSLKKLTDRDVDIEYVVDPSLLGGVLVKIGSTMYDTSIKGQLRLLKDELIKG